MKRRCISRILILSLLIATLSRIAYSQGYCPTGVGMACSGAGLGACTEPVFLDYCLMVDEAFVAKYNGDVALARLKAIEAFDLMAAQFRTQLGYHGGYNVTFNKVMFTNTIAPNSWNNGDPATWLSNFRGFWNNADRGCIKRDGLILFTDQNVGFDGVTNNSTALCLDNNPALNKSLALIVRQANPQRMADRIAHELMHTFGFGHLENSNGCQNACSPPIGQPFGLMCSFGGSIQLTGCSDLCLAKIFCDLKCSCLKDQAPILADDFTCPVNDPVQIIINADNPNPVIGCTTDGDITTLTVTLINNNTNTARNIRALISDNNKNIASFVNDGTGDFDCFRTYPGSRTEAWVTAGNDDPNTTPCEGEQFFQLGPEESITLKLKVKYLGPDPINGKDFSVSFYTGTALPPFFEQTRFYVIPYLVVPAGQFTTLYNNGLWKSNTPLMFSGNITMNNPNVFDFGLYGNNKLLFKAGTTMEINSGSSVKMPHIQVEGCKNMWKGITVKQGGTLEMTTATTIEDAQYAINLQKGSTFTASDCIFLNNNYGVYTNQIGTGNHNITLLGNKFGSEGDFKPGYSGQSPVVYANRGYAGVYLDNAGSLVLQASSAQTPNLFYKLHHGVVSQNTNLTVKNSTFENIEKLPGVLGLTLYGAPGKAIYANGGSLNVTGSGMFAGDPVNFDNCHTGIESFGASLTVTQNKMRSVSTGILSRIGIFKNVSVTLNNVAAKDLGIGVYHSAALPNGCMVQDNVVDMSGSANGVGISTGGSGDFFQTEGIFLANNVKVADGHAGFNIGVSYNLKVTQNNVSVGNAATKFGIGIAGGDQNTINCNNIFGPGEKGIYGLMAGRSSFVCNSTANTGLGLHFDGVFVGKGSILVAGNVMSDNAVSGLLMGADAVIGPQVHRGNEWTGAATRAEHLGTVQLANRSLFTVDANEKSSFLPNTVIPASWFVNTSKPTPSFQCITGNTCPIFAMTPDPVKDKEIATGALTEFSHLGPQLWLAQRRLYERLTDEGNPYPEDRDISQFLINAQTNGLKKHADLQTGLRQLFNLSTTDLNDLDYYETQIAQNIDQLAQIELDLNTYGISAQEKASLSNQRDSILQVLATITAQRATKLNSITSTRSTAAATLSSQNNALSEDAAYQSNEKTVNSIFLTTIATGSSTFSEAEKTSLQSIADQCPLAGGESVFRARDMLALVQEVPEFYNDDILCDPIVLKPSGTSGSINLATGNILTIFPNPANDQITIHYDLKKEGTSRVQFFNIYGQLATEVVLPDAKGQILMPTYNLDSGVYFYTLNGVTSGRVIIQH